MTTNQALPVACAPWAQTLGCLVKLLAVLISSVITAACIALPYPHKAYHYSNIEGRVIDSTTKQPIENIAVEIASTTVRTGANGEFRFVPTEKQHYFFVIPLLPFEFWDLCGDDLRFYDVDSERQSTQTQYRSMSLTVNSCRYPPFGAYRREENLQMFERLGDVDLRQ